jgi:ribonuclease HI
MMVSWQREDEDTMILNVDENALTNPGKAGYGGLIRKHDGSFELGFSDSIGISNILHAEIQALLTSVKLCWDARYRKLTCYSNSLQVVKLLMKETTRFHHYAYLLELIRMYLVKDWSISIHHIL